MKTMISMAMATIAALCLSFNASARHGDGDKFKSEKIAFITTELNLTPAEAEKFWPVYNQLSQEKKEALKTVIDAYKALEKAVKDKASDAEINKLTRRESCKTLSLRREIPPPADSPPGQSPERSAQGR